MIVQKFATAPTPAADKASVRGFVTIDGRPLGGVAVRARLADDRLETTTGEHGEYAFLDVEPGQWSLEVDYTIPAHRPQDTVPIMPEQVQLEAGTNVRYDIRLTTPPPPAPDRGPCCKPYGAPPARRRMV